MLPTPRGHQGCVGEVTGVAVAKGMMSCCPMRSRVFVKPLASMIAWTVVPYRAAMSYSVSPDATMWMNGVAVADGAGVNVSVGVAVGLGKVVGVLVAVVVELDVGVVLLVGVGERVCVGVQVGVDVVPGVGVAVGM
jgi:hypothetical protein